MPDAGDALAPYDAVLLGSFGGPEAPDEVVPFLRRVTAGRDIPDARLEAVGEHYFARGGPQPDQRPQPRAAGAAAGGARPARHRDPPAVGQPQLCPVLRRRPARGPRPRCHPGGHPAHQCLLVLLVVPAVPRGPRRRGGGRSVRRPTAWWSTRCGPTPCTPAWGAPGCVRCSRRCARWRTRHPRTSSYVTHSVPVAMDDTSGPGDGEGNLYADQHVRLAGRLTDELNRELGLELEGELVFCSRSGPPTQPWLEPDVNDRIEELAAQGGVTVVVRADRLRLRPHGGRARPRHRGRRDRRAARGAVRAGARRRAPTSCSSRGWST